MEYTRQDYEEAYGDKRNAVASITWADWLICIAVGVVLAFATGCTDATDAANIAAEEQAAHEQHQTIAAGWYSYTYRPIKASEANVTLTVCQNTDSTTRWGCYAVNP